MRLEIIHTRPGNSGILCGSFGPELSQKQKKVAGVPLLKNTTVTIIVPKKDETYIEHHGTKPIKETLENTEKNVTALLLVRLASVGGFTWHAGLFCWATKGHRFESC